MGHRCRRKGTSSCTGSVSEMGGRPRHCPRLHAQPAMLGTNRPLFAPCTGGNGLGTLAWWPWRDYPGCVYLTVASMMARLSPGVGCLLSLCLLAASVNPVPWWFLFPERVAEPLHHPSCQVPGSDGTAEHVCGPPSLDSGSWEDVAFGGAACRCLSYMLGVSRGCWRG